MQPFSCLQHADVKVNFKNGIAENAVTEEYMSNWLHAFAPYVGAFVAPGKGPGCGLRSSPERSVLPPSAWFVGYAGTPDTGNRLSSRPAVKSAAGKGLNKLKKSKVKKFHVSTFPDLFDS